MTHPLDIVLVTDRLRSAMPWACIHPVGRDRLHTRPHEYDGLILQVAAGVDHSVAVALFAPLARVDISTATDRLIAALQDRAFIQPGAAGECSIALSLSFAEAMAIAGQDEGWDGRVLSFDADLLPDLSDAA